MMHIHWIGYGYTAVYAHGFLREKGVLTHSVTTRSAERKAVLRAQGLQAFLWGEPLPDTITHVIVSAPPSSEIPNPFEALQGASPLPALQGGVYLSSTAVYGDHHGAWVSEKTPVSPVSAGGKARLLAEHQGQAFGQKRGIPMAICRLSGLYGPSWGKEQRNILTQLQRGTARLLRKDNHVFNRIHIEDVAQGVGALLLKHYDGVVNLSDDCPTSSEELVRYGAHLLGINPPPAQLYEGVSASLSPRLRQFYEENKRVDNGLLKEFISLQYPTYREGLAHCLKTLSATAP